MSNVLNEEKKQQVIALGRLGWALRRIERATGIRRETAAGCLKSVGIAVRQPGNWGHKSEPEGNPAIEVTPDPQTALPNPAIEVTADFGAVSTE